MAAWGAAISYASKGGAGMASGYGAHYTAHFNRNLHRFNRKQLLIDAQIEEENTEESVRRFREAGRRLKGTQRAKIAKSGFRLEGTPLMVMAESAENVELDAIRMRQEGEFKARQKRVQAAWEKKRAKAASKAATLGVIRGVFGG